MEDRENFISAFQNWRAENGFPKREQCREMFRDYKKAKQSETELEPIPVFEKILKQKKPALFLDSLFKLGGIINKSYQEERLESEKCNVYDLCLSEAYSWVKENNLIPELSDLSCKEAKKVFKSEEELIEELQNKYPDITDYLLNENSFAEDYNLKVIKEIKKYNKYVITTAVSNKKVNKNFLNSLKYYCEYNNALLLILPCEDVANRRTKVKWQLDPELKDFLVIYKDTYLNDNLMISDIKMSAKHINPLSGLQHLCHDKSIIIGSTKQELEYVGNFIGEQPYACMTTGAITTNDYDTDLFMSKRTSKLAEYDHINGAIIVEKEDNKIFHFRQIQADNKGNIADLDTIYTPDGDRIFDENIVAVLGDLHIGEEDFGVLYTEKDILEDLDVKRVVLHDVMTCASISHWDKNKTITNAIKYQKSKSSLQEEAENTANILSWFENLDETYIVRSNHHKFLARYLEDGLYAKDPINLYYSLDIVKAFLEGKDPFEYMIRNTNQFKALKGKRGKFKFLQKNERKELNGAEISLHGDKSLNGSRGNDKILYKSLKSAVMAHTHSPKIYRGIYTVGTTSKKDLDYIDGGLSTWGHSMCLIHGNGTKQLINIIKCKNNTLKWRV